MRFSRLSLSGHESGIRLQKLVQLTLGTLLFKLVFRLKHSVTVSAKNVYFEVMNCMIGGDAYAGH